MDASHNPETEKRIVSEKLKPFEDAIATLYIKNNMSGRLHFTREWAAAAPLVLGEELMRLDREGAPDKKRRAVLEDEAEARRALLLEDVKDLERKSAREGFLQMEFVKNLILRVGRGMALYLYARWIVDRFIPPDDGSVAEAEPFNNPDAGKKAAADVVRTAPPPPPPPEEDAPPPKREERPVLKIFGIAEEKKPDDQGP